jgi:hypothetical protein
MKFVWELEDIQCGTQFRKRHGNEIYIIGFEVIVVDKENDVDYLIVSLHDGCVCLRVKTKEELQKHFNQEDYLPVQYKDI